MKSNYLSIVLALAANAAALTIPFKQARGHAAINKRSGFGTKQFNVVKATSTDDDDMDLNTVNDLIYIANITVGGSEYPVQLDTGSSDLWIKGPSFPLQNVSHTTQILNLTYGIGWAYGNVSTAEIEFAGITIPSQAFLDVSSASNPALSYGADGILGLGFTSLSTIDSTINETGASWGRSVLYNAFLDNPNEPNFITFVLQRSSEPNDDVEGQFTVGIDVSPVGALSIAGEVNQTYSNISSANQLPTWPVVSPNRWNVLLDSFVVGTQTYSVSTNVSGAPSDQAVVLLDSGTSYTYCPVDVAEAIYGSVSGTNYDSSTGYWSVPCDAEIDMALQFGGQVFPLHPLDVVPKSVSDTNSCVGSFVPQSVSVGGGEFDWLIGDNFLRSVYSLYDFGDFDSSGNMGNPYIKLLSITDPNEASQEFVSVRGGTAKNNITYNASGVQSSSSGGSVSLSLASSTADKLSQLVDYIPAMLGILALNALALLIIAVVGMCWMLRRRRRGSSKGLKKGRSQFSLRSPTPYPGVAPGVQGSSSAIDLGDGHEYERVSVNAPGEPTDEPFTPPEPAFHAYEGDTLRPLQAPPAIGSRPYSMFSTSSGSGMAPRDYRVSSAGSDMTAFVPPSPGFKKDVYGGASGDRPKSIA